MIFRYNRGGYSNRGFNNRNNHGGFNNRNHQNSNLNRSLPSNQSSGSAKSDSRLNQSESIEPVSGSFKKTPKKEEPKVPTSLVNYEGSDDEDEDGLKERYYWYIFV